MPRIKATPESISIGNRIRKERESLSLTREKMAELLNITPGYIADLERGEARLSVSGLINLCHLFHCSTDFILFGRTDSFTISARIDALPLEIREQIDELVAKQVMIIESIYSTTNK
ncbi:MAG: helix-turn-helix transcriptional regulator [Clostridiales bacterium]|nr:helix-turn-helix transcriptional regulator [Clostridiales bacterium]